MAEKPTDTRDRLEMMHIGISAAKSGYMLKALTLLTDVYADGFDKLTTDGVSFYGLALGLVRKKNKESIDICKHAIRIQPLNPHNYVNLAKVYAAAGFRKKAIDTLEEGLERNGKSRIIIGFWKTLGMRQRPVLPFLSRDNALNVKLGRGRKVKEVETKDKE